MSEGAAKSRNKKTVKQSSLLCGKLFDETGDRLTPSHTKTRKEMRLRYYVSHRLIKRSGEQNLDGWRLPAQDLEAKVSKLTSDRLNDPSICASVFADLNASVRKRFGSLLKEHTDKASKNSLNFVERIELAPGNMQIRLSATHLAKLLN